MTNLRKDLELIEVVYNDSKKKATLTFLDVENGEVEGIELKQTESLRIR